MNPDQIAAATLDLANLPQGAYIKDGTVTEIIGSSATVAVDGGGTARPTILGLIPEPDQRVTMLFDPADNGTVVILGTIGGTELDLNDLDTIDDPELTDYLVMVDADDDASVKSLVSDVLALIDPSDILALVYPVGCLYFSTNSTNPATSLGFGTWSAFGAGRVPVGFDSGNVAFDTDEETGGDQTVTLTSAEMPSHTHTGPSHAHTGPTGSWFRYVASGGSRADGGTGTGYDRDTLGDTGSAGTGNTGSAGSGGAHNNLQPYIVVRMWKRTA